MSERKRLMNNMAPDVPECFHNAVMNTLNDIVAEEDAAAKVIPMKTARPVRRVVLIAAVLVMALATVAYAAYNWHLFEALSFLTGAAPQNADVFMQHSLHKEVVNGVEIDIREAGYDGRILFIQYRYRVLDAEIPLGTYEDGGISQEGSQLLEERNIGWWIDHLWIDGQCLDMAANSGSVTTGSDVPGEMIRTDYWRLDNLDMELSGKVQISLPIGERQPLDDYSYIHHPEKYTDDSQMLLPDKGIVTFTLDTSMIPESCITEHPNVDTVHPDVTVRVSEVTFSPLMTYITLDMKANEDVLKAYIAENGEGHYDDEGNLRFPYDGAEIYGSWIRSLRLIDGEGNELFPDHYAVDSLNGKTAKFLYPFMETIPEELYLAPMDDGQPDMTYAVKVR